MAYQTYSLDFNGYWRESDWSSLPAVSGIYCIYAGTPNDEEDTVSLRCVLYIGESSNVRSRVPEDPAQRRNKWASKLREGEELYASCAKISPSNARERAEAAMIFHHKPPCNVEYKNNFPFDRTTVNTSGRNRFLSNSFTVG